MYKIIVDSSADMNDELKAMYKAAVVPFKMYVDDKEYVDTPDFDADAFVEEFSRSKTAPRSACPSPAEFLAELHGADEYYIVTLSAKYSGSYNSALVAKQMYEEEHGRANIAIIDSMSATSGETCVVDKIYELKEKGLPFIKVVKQVEKFVETMNSFIVLRSYSNLIKNGRLPRWKGFIASALGIVPITTAKNGEIVEFEVLRTAKKVYQRLIEVVIERIKQQKKNKVFISYVTSPEKAVVVKAELEKAFDDIEVHISKCTGLSSMYADKNGLVVVF